MQMQDRHAVASQPAIRQRRPLLRIGSYRLTFQALTVVRLPAYAGSAWRGVFGHALKRTVCVTNERDCGCCLLYRKCPYPYIFETPPPPDTDRMRLYNAAPHPFVINPVNQDTRTIPEHATMTLELTVFGNAIDYLPYIIQAFRSAGERGIGTGHGRFRLQAVEQCNSVDTTSWQIVWEDRGQLRSEEIPLLETPACPDSVRLEFLSPLRLKSEDRLVRPEEFAFHDLFRNLLRRISMLMYFHENVPLDVNFADLTRESRALRLSGSQLRWQEWTRYSSRQRTTMQMGGLTGWIDLSGTGLVPFWPYLWLGQWIHAGKGTSMGLGRYRVSTSASLPDQTKLWP